MIVEDGNSCRSEWSSFDKEIASRGRVKGIEVNVHRMDEVIERFGVPYYAKVDIEGFDEYAVTSLTQSAKPKFISYENAGLSTFEYLVEKGYNRFRLVNQVGVPDQIAIPAMEGRALPWTFKPGASGLFG